MTIASGIGISTGWQQLTGGVTPPPVCTPLLLDNYPNATTGFSIRRINCSYTGPCMRVRRSSDNTEKDIQFLNGLLDTADLLSFVGPDDGLVSIWYDQSGNGNDAYQITANRQPTIVKLGVLQTQNSLPSIRFYANNDWSLTNPIDALQAYSVFNLSKRDSVNFGFRYCKDASNNGSSQIYGAFYVLQFTGTTITGVAGTDTTTTFAIRTALTGTTPFEAYSNGFALSLTTPFLQGNVSTVYQLLVADDGVSVSESIYYYGDKSTVRTGIENNIIVYYSL